MSRHPDLLGMPLAEMLAQASALRDAGHPRLVTYSRKVFIPLTRLCRDVCHYCTFARSPRQLESPYLAPGEVLDIARRGRELGCKEALFTLGDRPEARYGTARKALAALGYATTLEYLRDMARLVFDETGLLPHLNPGVLSLDELRFLRPVAPSMGLMLESASPRLCERGGPHFGSPDKDPAARLACIGDAGKAGVPLTTGLLIGIGETRRERLESLLALRELHKRHGHLQEIILQNFVPKPGTRMQDAPPPPFEELLWTIAATRIVFGPSMSIQAPPNLNPGRLGELIAAGINDWGGISPVTPDHVNPESPWPHLDDLAAGTAAAGRHLAERLAVYPPYVAAREDWIDAGLHRHVLELCDGEGLARDDGEQDAPAGGTGPRTPPATRRAPASGGLARILSRAGAGIALTRDEVLRLLAARGGEFTDVCDAADRLRQETCGDTVSYVVNRNINYTNVCRYKCAFCAFSKGKTSENLRGRPYLTDLPEISRRAEEAWRRGATEICLQGGIHPGFTGRTYLDICAAVREAAPDIHIHAFSPLEITQGAETLGLGIADYLQRLVRAGLNSLPGTAAEILDDGVRAVICPDKLSVSRWCSVVRTAHRMGIPTTATVMFGHVESPGNLASHLLTVRELQQSGGRFTEFVPLPFVHMEAPIYLRGRARPGPTPREAILMHAVARLALHGAIENIQASWPKLGPESALRMLSAGANDMGGTLMNESISRAAGARFGQELEAGKMEQLIAAAGRIPRQRTTLYGDADPGRRETAYAALPAEPVFNRPLSRIRQAVPD